MYIYIYAYIYIYIWRLYDADDYEGVQRLSAEIAADRSLPIYFEKPSP